MGEGMLISYAVIFCLAFTVSVLLAPVMRLLAVRIGAIDRPDGARKRHRKATPRLGGPVIGGAIFFALVGYVLWKRGDVSDLSKLDSTSILRAVGFVGGFLIILGLGVWDDVKGASPRMKLIFQTLAVVVVYAAGYRVGVPFVAKGTLSFLSFPITWFWLVACINAMNLVDGMDGLASGVSFFAGAVIFVLAAVYAKSPVALVAAAMMGSVVGFLMYNFHPAVMFLGDSGSLSLGYVIAVLAMAGRLQSHATVALLIPILALGLPIMDTFLAILRRWSRGLPISHADREHIHHKLLGMGFGHRGAVVVLYGACVLLASAALAIASWNSWVVGLVLGLLCVSGMTAVHFIGPGELALFFRRVGEKLRAPRGERIDSAAKRTAFWLKHSRSAQEAAQALEPYLRALPASGAKLYEAGFADEVIAEVKWEPTGLDGSIEEVFKLPSGRKVLVVVEGVDAAVSQLPEEVRRGLQKVFYGNQEGRRGLGVGEMPAEGATGGVPAR